MNGAPILSPLGLDGVRYFTRPAAFCTNKNIADLCKTIGFADCKQKNAAIVIDCVDDGNPGPFCGQTVKYIGCGYVDPEPGTPEECYPIGTTPGEAVLHCR